MAEATEAEATETRGIDVMKGVCNNGGMPGIMRFALGLLGVK